MSTFLENGFMLAKIRKRFMVFDSNGNYIDEIEFNEELMPIDDKDSSDKDGVTNLLTKRHIDRKQNGLDLLKRRRKEFPILTYDGQEFIFKPVS
jgi:hypothetical protein